ncbi:MAG: pyridoxal phosphate-dependent aminotransferase [Christensenellales bacterium]
MNFLSRLSRAVELKTLEGGYKESLDLSSPTSPYPPSPAVEKALKSIDAGSLNAFPSIDILNFRRVIADRYGLDAGNVFIFNGCDGLLSLCMKAFFNEGDVVAFADVTYEYYKRCATLNGVNYTTVPLDANMKINLEAYQDLDCNGVIICNPNDPTGIAVNKLDIVELVSKCPDKLFIIDERYAEFAGSGVAEFVKEYDNLVVIRGLSAAYGLGGVGFGYALANATLTTGLKNLRLHAFDCSVDCITQRVAEACFQDVKYMTLTVDKIINTREDFGDKLRQLGFDILPSSTNFLLVKHTRVVASVIEFQLKEQGIIVKHFKTKRLGDYLRITISTPENMELLLKKLKTIVK